MKNADKPAYQYSTEKIPDGDSYGLTKLEKACIDLKVPVTGDHSLDAVIRHAQFRDIATAAMEGLIVAEESASGETAIVAVEFATALLSELKKSKSP